MSDINTIMPEKLRSGRVDHVLWIARPENIDGYVKRLSETFGTSFEKADGAKRGFNYSAYVSWKGGLEIVTPLADGPGIANIFYDDLQQRGEGFGAWSMESTISRRPPPIAGPWAGMSVR